jgi:hypothetical protein
MIIVSPLIRSNIGTTWYIRAFQSIGGERALGAKDPHSNQLMFIRRKSSAFLWQRTSLEQQFIFQSTPVQNSALSPD